MGDPMTYLTVEVTSSGSFDDVRATIDDWRAPWASTVTTGDTIGSTYHGYDVEKARGVIEDLGKSVDRALVVSVYDTGAGTGRLFARVDDDLLLVDTVRGGETMGVDVVDYFRRHYGFDGVGHRANA